MSAPMTGSFVADKYIEQMMGSNILHFSEDSYNYANNMRRALKPHVGMDVEVILEDRMYFTLPDTPKLAGLDGDGFLFWMIRATGSTIVL